MSLISAPSSLSSPLVLLPMLPFELVLRWLWVLVDGLGPRSRASKQSSTPPSELNVQLISIWTSNDIVAHTHTLEWPITSEQNMYLLTLKKTTCQLNDRHFDNFHQSCPGFHCHLYWRLYICEQDALCHLHPPILWRSSSSSSSPFNKSSSANSWKKYWSLQRIFNHILEHYENKIYTLRYPTERLKSDRNFSFCWSSLWTTAATLWETVWKTLGTIVIHQTRRN